MKIDVPILISFMSLLVAVIVCIVNVTSSRRSRRSSDRQEATELTTLIVKLEAINTGIDEIKLDMRNTRNDIQELRDRLIIVEQSVKSAHHRVDKMEEKE